MGDPTTSVADWHRLRRTLVQWWLALDADWKSIVCGTIIVGLVVGFDVPVPG